MANEILKRDENHEPVLGLVTDDAAQEIRMGRIDNATKGLKVIIVGGVGTGTVTSVTASTGLTASPNPIIGVGTISLDSKLAPLDTLGSAGQSVRVNAGATALEYYTPSSGTGTVTNVSVVTANGVSGSVATATTTPAITLVLGAITPTTVNGLSISSTTGIFTLTNAKTLAVTNTLTLSGTDSTTMTFPSTSASVARIDAAQTFTGTQTFSQIVTTNNAITASGNAATVPITSRISTVTNNSAATLTITITTASAVDGMMIMVRVLDFSAVAQTLTLVNTENGTVSAPTTTNGSTTLPLTIGLQFNGNTSKWRILAVA